MGQRTVGLAPEQHKYFNDVDNSILQHSVDLGKVVLQADAIRGALGTLYQARANRMSQVLSEAGLDPEAVVAARIAPDGTLEVQLRDPPAESAS